MSALRPFRPALAVAAVFAGLALMAAACDSSEDVAGDDRAAVRQALLTDLADRVILPAHDGFVADAEALATATAAFADAPSEGTLDAARSAWRQAAGTWRQLSALNLPGVRFGLYHNRISTWPADTEFVEEAVATSETIDASYVSARGSNARGLPGLEYLLFEDDALADMSDPQRRAYARFVAADIRDQGRALRDKWSTEGGDEIGMFLDADTEGRDLQSSISRVVNEMAMVSEDLRYQKVGRPLGIARNASDTDSDPDPSLVESPYAGASMALFRSDLAGLRALVTGGGGTGLDDYLVTLDAEIDGQPLGEALLAQIDATDQAAAALGDGYRQAVAARSPQAEALYDETRTLLRLVKTDLANWLGVSITFSDNDGD
ncbi:MAG: imelysin family protein [Bacteroidota bacterium]